MLKIKYYQATVWDVFKKRPADEVYVYLLGNSDSLNYELTMMTVKGKIFPGFKIHRWSVFYLVIDVTLTRSVILSMYIGLLRQCAK